MEAPSHGISASRLCSWTHERGTTTADPPGSRVGSTDRALLARRRHFFAARDAFQAGGASTEMEQQLYQGFVASGLHAPQLRVELPLGNSPEFRSLLPDLLAALMPNIIAKGLAIGHLGDLTTLKDRLDQELDRENSFASYVALIGAFGYK